MKAKLNNMTVCSKPLEFEVFKTYYAMPLCIVGLITLAIVGLSVFFIAILS